MAYPVSKPRNEAVRLMGFGVEYFPKYVHTELHLHAVDVVLISVIIRGRGRHVMGDREYQEKAGSIGITHYGQVHDIITLPAGMEIYNVYLDLRGRVLPAVPAELAGVLAEILPLHPGLSNRLNRSVHFRMREPRRMGELLGRIAREQGERASGWQEASRLAFELFLIECCREAIHGGITLSPSDRQDYPKWLERIRRELDMHYAKAVRLDDLAEDARVSKGHLCRLFRQYTGKTVFEYLIDKRIGAAMLRLRSGSEKILAIAMECGFNDIAYFNRTFKRLTGQNPRAYRSGAKG